MIFSHLRWVKMLELLLWETRHTSEPKRISVTLEPLRFPSGKMLVESPCKLHMKSATPITIRKYWVQVFTVQSWQQFLNTGAKVSGFRENRWGFVRDLKPGDYLLCYLSHVSRWVGILEVTAEPYLDNIRIREGEINPCRAEVRVVTLLPAENGVPMRELTGKLSIFRVANWRLLLVASPRLWKESDARAVIDAIQTRRQRP